MKITDKITITNEDCMDLLRRTPDNYYSLSIVDPPYGIGMDNSNKRTKPSRMYVFLIVFVLYFYYIRFFYYIFCLVQGAP